MKTLIEVGTFDGYDSLKYHEKGYRVYTFEPKKDLFQYVVDKTKHLTNYTVIPKAVSLNNGVTTFTPPPDLSVSGFRVNVLVRFHCLVLMSKPQTLKP